MVMNHLRFKSGMNALFAILLAATLLATPVGCSWFADKRDLPAKELMSEALDDMGEERFTDAVDKLTKVKERFPYSKYALLAELKIADSLYRSHEYEQAAVAYEEFYKLHPKNQAVPYALYQIGMCYFKRVSTVDRDQGPAERAMISFERLVKSFPGSPYSQRALGHIEKCRESIAGHEFYVGKFYYDNGNYKAALIRFENVARNYPQLGDKEFLEELHKYILDSKTKIREEELEKAEEENEGKKGKKFLGIF
jgi:outer membrane protein assembly factor BamD